jgi:IS5 family transposase
MRPYGPGNHRATRGPGRPRRRPAKLHADNGYDYPTCRQALRRRGIIPRVARRGVESSQRLGHHRWEVERSLAWLLATRRLTVRYGGSADLSEAFLHLACALICARRLRPLVPNRPGNDGAFGPVGTPRLAVCWR